jgi:hypothetical protein
MYSYGLLETGCYYLVQEKLDSPISLIKATMESDHCMYVFTYSDEMITGWKRKSDKIYDIIECLTDEAVEAWQKYYNSSNEAYYEEDDE